MLQLRAKAFLLLAVFLSAGTSLPGPDALLYHHGAAELDRSSSHIEPAGGCLDHAEHCVLGRTATGSGAAASPDAESRYEPLCRVLHQPVPHPRPTCADRNAPPRTRAPPSFRSV